MRPLAAVLFIVACGSSERKSPSFPVYDGGVQDTGASPECIELNDNCMGEKICVDNFCEAAFPRVYNVFITEAEAPALDPFANDCWDLPCSSDASAPDLYVMVVVNGVEIDRTPTVSNTWFPSWSDPLSFMLAAPGSDWELRLLDEDQLDADDPVITCVAEPLDVEFLRGRQVGCGSESEERFLKATIEPR